MTVKNFLKTVSLVLIMVTLFSLSSPIFAASSRGGYVSEVKLFYADSYEEAKKAAGRSYTVIEQNLNPTLKTGVYLGYTKSINREDALTSIKIMNMQGEYSYRGYNEILKSRKDDVEKLISGMEGPIAAFQENYNKEPRAEITEKVYNALNFFIDKGEDRTGKGMGDYFLSYITDTDDPGYLKGKEDLTVIVMQGYLDYILTIRSLLLYTSETEKTTWIERMNSEEYSYDTIYDTIRGGVANTKAADEIIEERYSEGIENIRLVWNDLYDVLSKFEKEFCTENKAGKTELDTEKTFDYLTAYSEEELELPGESEQKSMSGEEQEYESAEAEEKILENTDAVNTIAYISFYAALSEMDYAAGEDMRMVDFFNRPEEDVEDEELIPMLEAMNDAQESLLVSEGIVQSVLNGLTVPDDMSSDAIDMINEIEDEYGEGTSVFEGVNRELFKEGNVALTNVAETHSGATNTSVWSSLFANTEQLSEMSGGQKAFGIMFCFMTGLTVGVGSAFLVKYAASLGSKALGNTSAKIATETVNKVASKSSLAIEYIFNAREAPAKNLMSGMFRTFFAPNTLGSNVTFSRLGMLFQFFGIVCFFAGLVMLVVTIIQVVNTIRSSYSEKSVSYTVIPKYLAHYLDAKNTDNGYVIYEASLGSNGSAGDLNGNSAINDGEGWLALYSTKDTAAGEPITDIEVKKTSDLSNDYLPVSLFANGASVNVIDKKYTGSSKFPKEYSGLYLSYRPADKESLAVGSAVTQSQTALVSGLCVIAGLGIGLACGYLIPKKKKNEI